ncbi:MAG: class I SAM-dependent methyltransferase [Pseudomonadota bacterium]
MTVAVAPCADTDIPLARQLSRLLSLPLSATSVSSTYSREYDFLLLVSDGSLALQQTVRTTSREEHEPEPEPRRGRKKPALNVPGPVTVEFGGPAMRHRRRSGHNELLGKAVGVTGSERPAVLDATAGLGRDAFVLADLGCTVTLCERQPIIATLLEYALTAARHSDDAWLIDVASRMQLVPGDVTSLAPEVVAAAQVIYLDPMFPPRGKSAAVKKEMAALQTLLSGVESPSAASLLHWAMAQNVNRVVLKRPLHTPDVADIAPSHTLAGKVMRLDVYVKRAFNRN